MTDCRTSARARLSTLVLAALVVLTAPARAENWPQFRGPGGQGHSAETNLPITWTATSNVAWKAALPGPGHSAPIVWGDRVFVTAFRSAESGSNTLQSLFGWVMRSLSLDGQLFVVCLDRTTGKVLWEHEVAADAIESVHPTNSPASPTPVTDGRRVYAYFGSFGVVALDFSGRRVWEHRIDPLPNEWGTASSPILHGDMLILNCDSDGDDFLLALDRATGKILWRTERDARRAWPVPMIWTVEGRYQIVVSGSERVMAYDPANGREIWRVEGLTTWVSPTPVAAHGLLFVTANGPGGNITMAIRPGGRGDVTSTHVAWKNNRSAAYNSSPIVVGSHLYTTRDGGIMTCLDARTGQIVWQERLPSGGEYYASPVAADGRLYVVNEQGAVTVVRAGPKLEVVATNSLNERTMASPAVSGGYIFLRTDDHLWAIGRGAAHP